MSALAEKLTCRVQLYGRIDKTENALEETDYKYGPIREMWAEIVPLSVSERNNQDVEVYGEYTHRITVRSPCPLRTDMYIVWRGQRFDIKSFEPHYKRRDRVIILASLEVGRRGENY